MDCNTARQLLVFDRPLASELAPPDAEALRTHLADCGACGRLAQAERTFDDQLGQALRAVPIPEGLRERLLTQLAAERDDWYRGWLLRGTGIAAAVALLTWGLWSWLGQKPEPLSPQQVSHEFFARAGLPPAELEKSFRDQGVNMVAPPQFNYHFLTWYTLAEFQNEMVPYLEFRRGDAFARVFVLSDRQFNLQNVAGMLPADSGGFKVEMQTFPVGGPPRFAFVIVYSGDSLDAFRVEENRPST
jgi:hypothetical protein